MEPTIISLNAVLLAIAFAKKDSLEELLLTVYAIVTHLLETNWHMITMVFHIVSLQGNFSFEFECLILFVEFALLETLLFPGCVVHVVSATNSLNAMMVFVNACQDSKVLPQLLIHANAMKPSLGTKLFQLALLLEPLLETINVQSETHL